MPGAAFSDSANRQSAKTPKKKIAWRVCAWRLFFSGKAHRLYIQVFDTKIAKSVMMYVNAKRREFVRLEGDIKDHGGEWLGPSLTEHRSRLVYEWTSKGQWKRTQYVSEDSWKTWTILFMECAALTARNRAELLFLSARAVLLQLLVCRKLWESITTDCSQRSCSINSPVTAVIKNHCPVQGNVRFSAHQERRAV